MPCFCEEHGNNVGFSTFCKVRVQSMCFSAAVRHMMTCVHVRHMYENFISLTKALLPPYQFVDLRKDACSINVQLAKMAQS